MSSLTVEYVPVDDLLLDPANARVHGKRNIESICGSLARFGQQKPIVVDKNGVIRAGNGTLEAARKLGWEKVAIVRSELLGADAVAFGIADNKTAELAEWDYEVLSGLLRELPSELLHSTGFESYEIEPLLAANFEPSPTGMKDSEAEGFVSFRVTVAQSSVINQAIGLYRHHNNDTAIAEGEALVGIAERFVTYVAEDEERAISEAMLEPVEPVKPKGNRKAAGG